MSEQRFGQYGVQVLPKMFGGYSVYVYYYGRSRFMGDKIAGPHDSPTEAAGFEWAHSHIVAHKKQVQRLRELTRG